MEHNGYDYNLQEKINSVSEFVESLCDGDPEQYMNTVKGLFLSSIYANGHDSLYAYIKRYYKDFEIEDDYCADLPF